MASSDESSIPWVEKYRPMVLDDVLGNDDTVQRLRAIAADGNMPNIIISGPPGTGKTTSVAALARALTGGAFKQAVLELNASDARGIDVVRDKIKMFAQKKVTLPPGRHKIIILDEADSMTTAAQQALRRTMEVYSSTTRFALACNISSKIIEPIQSRCAILRFSKLTDEQVLERVQFVCGEESIGWDPEGLQAIIFTAEGDMRNALNNLQATSAGFDFISEANVLKVADQPHPHTVQEIVRLCTVKDVSGACRLLEALWNQGYSASDIIGTLFKVTKNYALQESAKLAFIKEIGVTHMRIADGIDSLLQLSGLVARLCQCDEVAAGLP